MCGFVGVISKKNIPFPNEKLREMTSMITHRGPNDEGFFHHENWLALGFRRLSILDLSSKGHQPMVSSDGSHVIVFNGEVYNYLELKKELEAKGREFHSGTDTEVVLNAFIEWGADCVDRFIGMFAFFVVNLKERKAFICRDQLGIKPLFHYEDDQYHVFCSEIKSLLPYTQLEPNRDAISEYLVFRFVIGDRTLFKNVENLPPGNCYEFANDNLRRREYFNISSTFTQDSTLSFNETCDLVEQTLLESVKIHLRSDVELGVQLSGGVDSSLLTAMASAEVGKRFHTFSISFDEQDFDESKYQKMMSERYNTEHHDYPLGEDEFCEHFPKTIWHYEHPLNDPNTVATYFLTTKAKKSVTVMLSGEGADESFLGYTRFLPGSIRRLKMRTWLHRHSALRKALYKLWPISKGRDLFNVTRYHPAMYVPSYADLKYIDKFLDGDDSCMVNRHKTIDWAKGNVLDEALIQDQSCDLLQWFWRADRAGMASSMELRVPFCTKKMFQLANSIPYDIRVYGGERKAVLKKVAEKYMDHEQIYRKKIGFGTPIDPWINRDGSYTRLFDDIMTSKRFKEHEFTNPLFFDSLYQRHKNGSYRERSSSFLWTYFNLEIWYRLYFEGDWRKFAQNS